MALLFPNQQRSPGSLGKGRERGRLVRAGGRGTSCQLGLPFPTTHLKPVSTSCCLDGDMCAHMPLLLMEDRLPQPSDPHPHPP